MSVLLCGGCLNIFISQLCGNIVCLYFNCDYTQPVCEQISNTNQFIQNVQPTGRCTVPTYPLRVYSEILMTHIARGQRNADRSHSLVIIYHNNPQENKCVSYQHVSRCAQARCGVRLQISTYCQTVTDHLSLRNPPRSLWVTPVVRDCKLLHAVTTVTEHLSMRNSYRSQLFTFSHLLLKKISY